jgi:hypothetical protein
MGLLGKIQRPEAGGDPRELWKTVVDIMDVLDNLTVTILPTAPGARTKITEGDIAIDLSNFLPKEIGGVVSSSGSGASDGGTPDGSAGQ